MEAGLPDVGHLKYRPDIDGLRAIAVLVVFLFHYGVTALPGGFVGVDIFFVISGYLITGLLAQQIAGSGLSLLDFYARRIRRILPALLAVIVASLVAGWFFLLPFDYVDFSRSAAYSAVGLGNLYFFEHTGYFDRAAAMRPLLHLWSLGVEEQFYLVWPALLALVAWIVGKRRPWMMVVIGLVTAVAFVESARVAIGNPTLGFYVPQGRAWELALGALLVFLPPIPNRASGEVAGLAGLCFVAYAVLFLTPEDAFPGVNSLYPCLGAALLVWPRAKASFVSRGLGVFPLRRVGEVSYSLYLWHWPLIVFLRIYENGGEPSVPEKIGAALASCLLAYLSWRYVETPFRRARPGRFRTIAVGVTSAASVVGICAAIMGSGGVPGRVTPETLAIQNLDQMWEWACPARQTFVELNGFTPSRCEFGAPWDEATTHVMLWGDSHAEHMAPLIQAAIGDDLPDAVFLFTPCPAALGGVVQRESTPGLPHYGELCADMRMRGLKLLKNRPDVNLVVLASAWRGVVNNVAPPGKPFGGPDAIGFVRQGIEEFLDAAAAPGRRFIIIGDVPQVAVDPVSCAVANTSGLIRKPCSGGGLTQLNFKRWHGPVNDALVAIAAERNDTITLLPSAALCTGAVCATHLNGQLIYRDGGHLRRNLDETTRRQLADLFGITAALKAMN